MDMESKISQPKIVQKDINENKNFLTNDNQKIGNFQKTTDFIVQKSFSKRENFLNFMLLAMPLL